MPRSAGRRSIGRPPASGWPAKRLTGFALFSPDGAKSKALPKVGAATLAFSRDGKTVFAVGEADMAASFLKAIDVAHGAVRTLADYGPALTISGGLHFHTRLSLLPGREEPGHFGSDQKIRPVAAGGVPAAASLVAILAVD